MLPSIDLHTYLLFVTAAMALVLTPGPDTVFVLTQGVSAGKRGGLASALGVSTGVLVHTSAAALGLAALLRASAGPGTHVNRCTNAHSPPTLK